MTARFDVLYPRQGKVLLVLIGAMVLTTLAGGVWLGFGTSPPVEEPLPPEIPALSAKNEPTPQPVTLPAPQAVPAEPALSAEPATPQLIQVVKVEKQPSLPGESLAFAEYQQLLKTALANLEAFPQYTATLTRQERKKGKLTPKEVMQIKLRQEPYAVYMGFTHPRDVKGQEAIYVKGKNNDKIVGHGVGLERLVGTVYLALSEERAINQTGLYYLAESLVTQPERNPEVKSCEIYRLKPEKVGERLCEVILVTQARPVKEFNLSKMRVWIDQEWGIVVRNERWNWKDEDAEEQELARDVIYTEVNRDVKLTEEDFNHRNKAYKYP